MLVRELLERQEAFRFDRRVRGRRVSLNGGATSDASQKKKKKNKPLIISLFDICLFIDLVHGGV